MNNPFETLREQYMQRKALWEDKCVADRISAEKHIGTWNKALEILDAVENKWMEENSESSNSFSVRDALVAIDNMRQDIRNQAISDVAEAIRTNFVFSNQEEAIRFANMMDIIIKQLKEK